jgi:hypothetical protein
VTDYTSSAVTNYTWPFTTTSVSFALNDTSCTCSTIGSDLVWTRWNLEASTTATNTATIVATYVWNNWNTQWNIRSAATVEEDRRRLREWETRQEEMRRDAAKRAERALEAEKRAEELLRSTLSVQQREDLEKNKYFFLETLDATGRKRRYRIDRGTHGNVKEVNEQGSVLREFCVQPEGVPVPDSMLAQKLYLEHDLRGFLNQANVTRIEAGQRVFRETTTEVLRDAGYR